jgi:hypothetical protein
MPLLSDLSPRNKTVTIPIAIGDHELNVTFYPNKLNAALLQELQALERQDPNESSSVNLLCEIIADWDLEDYPPEAKPEEIAAGKVKPEKVPLTPERVAEIPLQLQALIGQKVNEYMSVDPTRSNSSRTWRRANGRR